MTDLVINALQKIMKENEDMTLDEKIELARFAVILEFVFFIIEGGEMNMGEFDGSKVKALSKQITRTVGLYEGGKLDEGATRIIIEALMNEIDVEVKKLRR